MDQCRGRIIQRRHPPQAARLSRRTVRESAGLKTPLKLNGVMKVMQMMDWGEGEPGQCIGFGQVDAASAEVHTP